MTLRTVARIASIAAVAAVSVVATIAPAHAATDTLTGKKYVALGDSFASGYGLQPYTGTAGCGQSADNYAHRIAQTYGLDLTDVSCAGALFGNVVDTAQAIPGGGTVPPQLDAVTADTAVISVMIGGNDALFTQLAQCAANAPGGPLLSSPTVPNCKTTLGDLPLLIQATIGQAYDNLFAAIKQKAPNAEIVLLGYPALSPTDGNTPAGGCFSSVIGTGVPPLPTNAFPFTDVDRGFIAEVSATLDAAEKAAAERNGVRFVSTLAATDTHTPCAGTSDPYVNGVTLTSLTPPAITEGSLHPNAAGVAFLEAQLAAALDAAFPATPTDPGDGGTQPPATGGTGGSTPPPATTVAATGATAQLAATGSEPAPLVAAAALILGLGLTLLIARRRNAARTADRAAD